MLASLRSLVPKIWGVEHEVAFGMVGMACEGNEGWRLN